MITYSATKVSLYDAVLALATISNYHVHISPIAVEFSALPPVIVTTREYLVPPDYSFRSSQLLTAFSSAWYSSNANRDIFHAEYLPRTRIFIVRANEHGHHGVLSQIQAAWTDYYAKTKSRR